MDSELGEVDGLKRCPFCGREAVMITDGERYGNDLEVARIQFNLGCNECGIYFQGRAKHKLIDSWNQRVNFP